MANADGAGKGAGETENPCISAGTEQELLGGAADGDEGAGQDTELLQSLQESRIAVGDTVDDELAVLFDFGEGS